MSMAAVGNPYDHAQAERFFQTRKREEVSLNHDQTFAEAHANLGRFIGEVSNAKRLHSSLGSLTPIECEADDFARMRR